ncbi:MAG TPA: hypothetical protein VK866_16750 [Acidimicrobiales bacterium]|nr:hypothetical protein [Acidimicrobiales bacterium]
MTSHPFLSEPWIQAVQRIKVDHVGDPTDQPVRVNGTVTGVPFGAGRIEMHSAHGPVIGWQPGHLDDAEFGIEVDYQVARELVMDTTPNALERAIAAGDIVVTGDVDEFRDWWHSRVADPDTDELEDQVRAITA